MTNPAQLKYLDAIGIPVWVSRDLIETEKSAEGIENKAAKDKINLDLANHLPSQESNGFSTENLATAAENHQKAVVHGHVGDLLNSLEEQTQQQKNQYRRNSIQQKAPLESGNSDTQLKKQNPPLDINSLNKQATEIGRTAHHAVYACGDQSADWMIIGESPDISKNGQGQPYAGEAGTLLSNMLRAVGIEEPRKQAYLVNILNFSNQFDDSQNNQVNAQLNSLLLEKINQVRPKILLLVGQVAAQNILETNEPLVRMRSKKHLLAESKIPVVVTYYPSYLLSKPLDKRKAWEDLKLAMRILS